MFGVSITVEDVLSLLALVGGLVSVWVHLNGRIVRLEADLLNTDKRIEAGFRSNEVRMKEHVENTNRHFDKVIEAITRVEDKLDHKMDKSYRE